MRGNVGKNNFTMSQFQPQVFPIIGLAGMVKTNPTLSGKATSGRIYFTITVKP